MTEEHSHCPVVASGPGVGRGELTVPKALLAPARGLGSPGRNPGSAFQMRLWNGHPDHITVFPAQGCLGEGPRASSQVPQIPRGSSQMLAGLCRERCVWLRFSGGWKQGGGRGCGVGTGVGRMLGVSRWGGQALR